MTAIAAMTSVYEWIDDRFNPIVIKELRQSVMSRFVTVVLMLFLVAQLFTLGIFLLSSDATHVDFNAGRHVFMVLHGILLTTGILFVPLYVGVRLAAERSDANVDLLFVTTLRPRKIVTGKLLSGIVVTMLIYSATAPFMVLTYLLRGIDLPTILVLLGFDFVVIVGAIQLAIFAASIPVSSVMKILIALVTLFLLGWALVGIIVVGAEMVYYGVGSQLGTFEFWGPALAVVAMIGVGAGALFSFSVAMLTPASANRAVVPRLFLTLAMIATYVICLTLFAILHDEEYVQMWYVFTMLVCGVSLFIAISERDEMNIRLRRSVPRRAWLRPMTLPFTSGAANGLVWSVAMIVAAFFAAQYITEWVVGRAFRHDEEVIYSFLIFTAYCFCYAMSGLLLRRIIGRGLRTVVGGVFALILAVLGVLGPPLVLFFVSQNNWDAGDHWLLFNPFGVSANWNDSQFFFAVLLIVSVWGGAMVLLNALWFIRQIRDFRPTPKAG